jgi:hypothetical protein
MSSVYVSRAIVCRRTNGLTPIVGLYTTELLGVAASSQEVVLATTPAGTGALTEPSSGTAAKPIEAWWLRTYKSTGREEADRIVKGG